MSSRGSWLHTTIGEQVTLQRGYDINRSQLRPGTVPVIASSGVIGRHDEAVANGPGVLIGRKGSLGTVHWSSRDYWPHSTALWVKDFHGNDPRFVYYFFKWLRVEHLDVGSANPTLNRNHVHSLPVLWPPLDQQREIAHTLTVLDDRIELNRRMNRTLESIARAIFESWFVEFDPVPGWARGKTGTSRDPSGVFPQPMAPSLLGPIPEGWRVATIGDVAVELEAGSRPAGGVGGIGHGVPSIGAESIVGIGRFDYAKTKYVTRDFWSRMRRGHVKDFDVLVYKDGGRPGMFEPHATLVGDGFPFSECCINEHVYRLRVSNELSQVYIYFWLTSEFAMGEMRERGTGVAIPSLNSTAFRAVPVLVPDAAIVESFSKVVEPLVAAILANAQQSLTLLSTRDVLLPHLLRGELHVRGAQHDAPGAREAIA